MLFIEWWSGLSLNEQREYSKKHLDCYYYACIWDYSLSKYVKDSLFCKIIEIVWDNEINLAEPKNSLIFVP